MTFRGMSFVVVSVLFETVAFFAFLTVMMFIVVAIVVMMAFLVAAVFIVVSFVPFVVGVSLLAVLVVVVALVPFFAVSTVFAVMDSVVLATLALLPLVRGCGLQIDVSPEAHVPGAHGHHQRQQTSCDGSSHPELLSWFC